MKAIAKDVKLPEKPPEWIYTDRRDACRNCLNTGVVVREITLREFYAGKLMPAWHDPNAKTTVAEPCDCAAARAKERRFLNEVEGVPAGVATFTTVNKAHSYKADALRLAEELVDRVAEGKRGALVFYGPTGLGKTFIAVATLRAVHDAGGTVKFLPSREFCEDLREKAYSTEAVRAYIATLKKDLVVLDDFGREYLGAAEGSVLARYAEFLSSYEDKGALIITTNLEFAEALKNTFGNEAAPIARRLAAKQIKFG